MNRKTKTTAAIHNRRFQRRRSHLQRIRRIQLRLQLLRDLADDAIAELRTTSRT